MLSEKGFSLIEVLISLTILSVSVIGISQFFHQANQISAGNNTKLVATNLARMTLERIQINHEPYGINLISGMSDKSLTKSTCTTSACQSLYEMDINNKPYKITIRVKQLPADKEIGLYSAKVLVNYGKPNPTSVEGYLKDAARTN
ncbi:prepilin-type N-terminal cleavage/methylation domain-containing protein [Fictibacillus sp. 5RED26]|uniref:type IV pilus modification PilV family protein n=1 Tax=Fictibacillus sp. 5RED26 TaxID=2745876 RepID=UPI0018CDC335|nr:prepilin-type N-terminal cleavage/methylation domain-containing protein [Fictibacillus sp. 5RED26]MBH0156851.1 prepilin-type N-terminal cleavage/methylation domain-containing protein [Fictibacillus sp. 5RED26]